MKKTHPLFRTPWAARNAGAAALALACGVAAFQLMPPAAPLDSAAAQALREKILKSSEPLAVYDLREAALAPELVEAGRLLPQTSRQEAPGLARLYRYAQTCADAPPVLPKVLEKAWIWHAHLCSPLANPLPDGFFERTPLIHPGGGSYVAHALRSGEPGFDAAFLRAHAPQVHAGEWRGLARLYPLPPAPFAVFAGLSPAAAEKVAQGYPVARGEGLVLLRRASTEDGVGAPVYLAFPEKAWDDAAQVGFASRRWALALLAGFAGLAGATLAGIYGERFLRRAREGRDRRLIMQALAHEIRTPVTALKLALEPLRRGFDGLTAPQQESVLAIGGETERLTRLVETTQAYLQAFIHKGTLERHAAHNPTVHELVDAVVEQAALQFASRTGAAAPEVAIERAAPDGPLGVDPFWLGLCVRNLVDNALVHGRPPVAVRIAEAGNGRRLRLEVRDAGTRPPGRRVLARWTRPFVKGAGSPGLGLGLYLVRTIMRRLGGRLELSPPASPVAFALVLDRAPEAMP